MYNYIDKKNFIFLFDVRYHKTSLFLQYFGYKSFSTILLCSFQHNQSQRLVCVAAALSSVAVATR